MSTKTTSWCKSVKSEVFRSDCISKSTHYFSVFGSHASQKMTATFCITVFTALQVKATLEPNPKMFPESIYATNTNFTRANNTQLFSSRCNLNLVVMETADFLTAMLFV